MENLLSSYLAGSVANSAKSYDLALQAARETNVFNAQQAVLNRAFQQTSADKQMAFEKEQAQAAMDFSERMSNSVYQRAVSDLKAAGLSPLLAYGNLQTSAPSGVSASGSTAAGSSASGVKADVASALQVQNSTIDKLISAMTFNLNSALRVAELDLARDQFHYKKYYDMQNFNYKDRSLLVRLLSSII